MAKKRRWCEDCGRHILADRKDVNHVFHLLVTLFTCGFWVIPWMFLALSPGSWRCPQCGQRC